MIITLSSMELGKSPKVQRVNTNGGGRLIVDSYIILPSSSFKYHKRTKKINSLHANEARVRVSKVGRVMEVERS